MNRRQMISAVVMAPSAARRPTDIEVETTAEEMFHVGQTVAMREDRRTTFRWVTWPETSEGQRAGWLALARWHLERVR